MESTSAMLSLTLSVNGPLQVTLTPEVTFLLYVAFINVVEVRKNSRIKKFIQEDSNLECTNSVVDWWLLHLLVHIWILNSDKIFAKIIWGLKLYFHEREILSSITSNQDDPRFSYFNVFSSIATQKIGIFLIVIIFQNMSQKNGE